MDNLFDDILQKIIKKASEIASDIDVNEIISDAYNSLSDGFFNLSEFNSMTDDARENIINSIVENIGGNHDTIVENISFVSNLDLDSFCEIDSNSFSSIPSDFSDDATSFCGSSDNSDAIKYQEERLSKAKHDIEYYEKEIRNFNEKTSGTYHSTCVSKLNNATEKAKDAENRIQNLKKSLLSDET